MENTNETLQQTTFNFGLEENNSIVKPLNDDEKINTIISPSVISNITENCEVVSSDIVLTNDEFMKKVECELNKLTMDVLKEKCKKENLPGIYKLKKPELIQLLVGEFLKLIGFVKNKKTNELKIICKKQNIKCSSSSKKDTMISNILEYCSINLLFNLNEPKEINLLEQQEEQLREKLREDLLKQNKIDEEKRVKDEEEKRVLDELKRLKEEESKKGEKEKEDSKKKKQSIPKQIKTIVWNNYIGHDIIKHKCLCCKKAMISNTDFHVGHVMSEKNGGTQEINNLRPICSCCNHSMGTENMIDYVVKYGLYIG